MKTWNDYPVTLSVKQVSEILGINRLATITDKCKNGDLPAFKATGKAWRIDRDRLRAMFASKVEKNRDLADQLGEIELALATLAAIHRDDEAMAEALRTAHAAALAAYNEARADEK